METPGDRMKHYIEKLIEISVPEFAEIIGVQSKSVYNIINNEIGSVIGKATADKIKKHYPKFPMQWVKNGVGTPGKDTAERRTNFTPECDDCKYKDKTITIQTEEIVFLKQRLDAMARENDRLEKQILRLEKLLDKSV